MYRDIYVYKHTHTRTHGVSTYICNTLLHSTKTQPSEVYRQAFWLGRLGAKTPKRSILWSSARAILNFRRYARLTKEERKKCRGDLVHRYRDSSGRVRFTGNKKLKGSQCHVRINPVYKVSCSQPAIYT